MFDGRDDEDDDDHATTTTTSSSSPDDNDVEILLDRSRKLILKAEDAECKCCFSREEYLRPSGNRENGNGGDARTTTTTTHRNGDWKVKEWRTGDNGMTSHPPHPPLPPPPAAADDDDLQSCQSSTMSFDASTSRRDPSSSSSESREDLSLHSKQRSSLCDGEKPSRRQGRGRRLDDCAAGKFNIASDERNVTWRANGRCQQVAAYRCPPFRSFLSDVTGSRSPTPVINIRKATVFISSRIGSNREKKREKNSAQRPKTKTEIPSSGSFLCHHRPRLLQSLQWLELDADSVGDDGLPRYPPPSPSSPSPCPPPPVSDCAPVERAPEAAAAAAEGEFAGASSETSEGDEEEAKRKEKCGFRRMLDLTIAFLILALVLMAFFRCVLGPPKTKDCDPC